MLLKRIEVERITGLSRSSIYAKMNEGGFPKPVRVGLKAVRWVEEEIRDWITERMEERLAA